MLTKLKISNFKAWSRSEPIELKPVTMLLGTNSSGKSSLIQSLLLLKQTVQSPDRTIHLNLGGDEVNDLFNFGDFEDVIFKGASAPRHFTLGFSFKVPKSRNVRVDAGEFEGTYSKLSSGSVAVQEARLATEDRQFRAIRREKGAYSLVVNQEALPRGKSRNFAPERSIALPAEAIVFLERDGGVVEDLSLAIRRELESIAYLGPLRRKPERDYVWNKSTPGGVGSDGHRAVDVLLASALAKGDEHDRVISGVSYWLSRMKIADRLEVRQLGRSTRYEVVVHRGKVSSNLRDVGIGVSQVLPVLTLAFFAPEGSTIILEEPEIHLHPLAQSVLAELFVEVSKKRKVQFLVETHSEHLFRRMQTLVARRKTVNDDIAMYFVEPGRQGAKLRKLPIDEYGRVRDWPNNFFGDALGETREQAKLMFARQVKERQG